MIICPDLEWPYRYITDLALQGSRGLCSQRRALVLALCDRGFSGSRFRSAFASWRALLARLSPRRDTHECGKGYEEVRTWITRAIAPCTVHMPKPNSASGVEVRLGIPTQLKPSLQGGGFPVRVYSIRESGVVFLLLQRRHRREIGASSLRRMDVLEVNSADAGCGITITSLYRHICASSSK